nr:MULTISPECIES: hypothetical protein [unclassified Streptomyces]
MRVRDSKQHTAGCCPALTPRARTVFVRVL